MGSRAWLHGLGLVENLGISAMNIAKLKWDCEVERSVYRYGSAKTGAAVTRSMFEASPSWPEALKPQQRTSPLASSAHEWLSPSATAVAPVRPVASIA